MPRKKKEERKIYTLDLETDPFKHGRLPKPFACGIYDGQNFVSFWRKVRTATDIIKMSVEWLVKMEPAYVFIHNGGRFDLFYYLKYLADEMFILNNRIVEARIGKHIIRDSFAIMPFALAKYKKDDIEYWKMESKVREKYRDEIISYLRGDCVYLHELCTKFVARFGPRLTIGSTALHELKSFHKFDVLTAEQDEEIRSKYYFGGRVECFEKGVIKEDVKVFDVNSMYPHSMRSFLHPIGKPTLIGKKIRPETFFISVTGKSKGALAVREKNGTQFPYDTIQTFNTTIHEYNAAVDLDLFEPHRIEQTIDFADSGTFSRFVDEYYSEREHAKRNGDAVTNLFTKFVLNSAYGKFAQNPENCFDFAIKPHDVDLRSSGWIPAFLAEGMYAIWKKRSTMGDVLRVNVATAASITGAARSVLLRAIAKADRPLYCDTDSIICRSLDGVPVSDTELGAWKLEKSGDKIAIAGRKLYSVFDGEKVVKLASKGVKLTGEEIERVALGEVIKYKHIVPSFKWDGSHSFIKRNVRMT